MRLTAEQLVCIADVSEKYATGNLHITTRQDIQLHYVKLGDSPKIWEELAKKQVTAREACGNTVRNITGSAKAGIDPNELFDISPYVHATYEYFLRNPICQAMGCKIKIAFSSSDADSAYTYFHDFCYRLSKRYFYDLLKPLAAVDALEGSDFFDLEQDHEYRQEIGVGECAGVMLDVVGTKQNEKYAIGTVGTIVDKAKKQEIGTLGIIIIGDVVSLHRHFNNAPNQFYKHLLSASR